MYSSIIKFTKDNFSKYQERIVALICIHLNKKLEHKNTSAIGCLIFYIFLKERTCYYNSLNFV